MAEDTHEQNTTRETQENRIPPELETKLKNGLSEDERKDPSCQQLIEGFYRIYSAGNDEKFVEMSREVYGYAMGVRKTSTETQEPTKPNNQ
jgi:hypothetical protein